MAITGDHGSSGFRHPGICLLDNRTAIDEAYGVMDEKPKLPSPWERLSRTRAQLAAEQGISVRTLQRQFAVDRDRERRRAIEDARKDEESDPERLVYVTLTTEPGDGRRPWYNLATDECSVESGSVRIGAGQSGGVAASRSQREPEQRIEGRLRVRSLYFGVITTEDTSRTDGKPQPTIYDPDSALKGGKG